MSPLASSTSAYVPSTSASVAREQAVPTASIPRRHDLDALRAIAMLLGIALHAAIAYIPSGGPEAAWPVQDPSKQEMFATFMAMIHGFRMPLFFLVSGFFTAMLWRKRGLKKLIEHRFKRIFLPLVASVFTIVPAVWICSILGAVISTAGMWSAPPNAKLSAAALSGDVETVRACFEADDQLDANFRDASGSSPLIVASFAGHTEVVTTLLEFGADPDFPKTDGTTPLHVAAMFGREEVTRLLLDQGANPEAKNNTGATPLELTELDHGTTQFFATLGGLKLDREELDAGRKGCATLLLASVGKDVGTEDLKQSESGILYFAFFLFPFFHHLWFLWFLCWLVAGFAIYALISDRLKWNGAPDWLVVSKLIYLWLIPLTVIPQAFMGLMHPVYGPDTSVGMLPMPHVLFYYALFFGYGALYFDSNDTEGRVSGWWRFGLPVSILVLFPLGYEFALGKFGFRDQLLPAEYHRSVAVVLQVAYAWVMTFSLMGLFRAHFSTESKWMRYISDSSYWLYLAHLPLVMVAQGVMARLPLPAIVKFSIVTVGLTVFLLLTYEYLVRYTFIGTMLNGPRSRPQKIVMAAAAES